MSVIERLGKAAAKFSSGESRISFSHSQERRDMPLRLNNGSFTRTMKILSITPDIWINKWVSVIHIILH